ncbi:MAG: hypothetical protein ACLSDQ_00890 [Adlercreutzia equolifaciens]
MSAVDVIDGSENAKRTDFIRRRDARLVRATLRGVRRAHIERRNASQLFTFVTCSYTTYANERTLVYAQPAES